MFGLILKVTCEGKIECICNTDDCRKDHKSTCMAESWCYVEYMSTSGDKRDSGSATFRGCIDEKSPLLCDNRRPKQYTGSWPVLHCCKEEWCNRDVLPTSNPWISFLDSDEKEKERNTDDDSVEEMRELKKLYDSLGIDSLRNDEIYDYNNQLDYYVPNNFHRYKKTINPLYIGVPVAGACVLLAIIIFAIFILKRHNQYMEDYTFKSNLRQCTQTNCCHNVHNPQKCLFVDCERSSSCSETKLLGKV